MCNLSVSDVTVVSDNCDSFNPKIKNDRSCKSCNLELVRLR